MNKDKIFFFIQSLLKYNSFNFGIKLRSLLYKKFFKNFGVNIQIKDGVTFKYPSEIEIGNNCVIGEYCYIVGKGGLQIGNDVLIGSGTKIVTSEHNFTNMSFLIREQGLSFVPIRIENNIWIGFNVVILAGSKISEGSIVGANSLINRSFHEKNIILFGSPAKVYKERGLQ